MSYSIIFDEFNTLADIELNMSVMKSDVPLSAKLNYYNMLELSTDELKKIVEDAVYRQIGFIIREARGTTYRLKLKEEQVDKYAKIVGQIYQAKRKPEIELEQKVSKFLGNI